MEIDSRAVRLLITAVMTISTASGCSSDTGIDGYEVKQQLGEIEITVDISSLGIAARATSSSNAAEPFDYEGSLNFQTSKLHLMDHRSHQFSEDDATNAIDRYINDLQVRHSIQNPPLGSTSPQSPGGNLSPGIVTKLENTIEIANEPASGYQTSLLGSTMKVWYAADASKLPKLPPKESDLASALQAANPLGARNGVSRDIANRLILRAEVNNAGAWETVLDTKSIGKAHWATSVFDPPSGYSRLRRLGESGPGGTEVSGEPGVPRPPENRHDLEYLGGPFANRSSLYLAYWGKEFVGKPYPQKMYDAAAAAYSPAYFEQVRQYHVQPGRVVGARVVEDEPPPLVGSYDFLSAAGLAASLTLRSNTPKIWWYGGPAPLYALIVSDGTVSSSSWGGYHWHAASLAWQLLPFLLQLASMSDVLYLVAKVGKGALSLAIDQTGFDTGTANLSHEMVEAILDPYVLTQWAWVDIDSSPLWEGEVSDLCQDAQNYQVNVSSYVFAQYWSNRVHGCVPPPPRESAAAIYSGNLDWGYDAGRAWADANGDGKSDYCRVVGGHNFTDGKVACTLSTGTGFAK